MECENIVNIVLLIEKTTTPLPGPVCRKDASGRSTPNGGREIL